ncbi:FAD-dependent oxidoreductase [Sinomonas sp. ASV322]|uniref:NAD(P)/FAD-dependent oxidoreductase n=1 Tax=Sinomonas sp. ASV322 TaxID=3041920 RepID=UPI0027DB3014|nr:FAD-dependent oxidoreductase [Sinomonas sp. ASV322]MDQ4502398.1 FAD-dependent oxidoreductase [Sinomonas sp. ASV322]
MKTLAIVGSSLAGLSAARAARSEGFDGRLVLIGDELHRPYDRPPLSKDFLSGKVGADSLALEDPDQDLGAEWLLGTRAEALDAAGRTVVLADGRRVSADGVVLATGSTARVLPGFEGFENVYTLRTLDDAWRLRDELRPGAKLLVVGAGLIGAEVASTARAAGVDVVLIAGAGVPLGRSVGPDMGSILSGLHAVNGVELIRGATIVGHRGDSGKRLRAVELSDGRIIEADAVLVAIGGEPATTWLEGSGIHVSDGIVCDDHGRTNIPGVVAVGDCAAWHDRHLGRTHRQGHWNAALTQPARAVKALLGTPDPEPLSTLPYFWSDQYGVRIQFSGHAELADRIEIEEGDATTHSFLAAYYRGDQPVAVLSSAQPRLFAKRRREIERAQRGEAGQLGEPGQRSVTAAELSAS